MENKQILNINSLLGKTQGLHHDQPMWETPDLVLESKFTQDDLKKNSVTENFYHYMDGDLTHVKIPFRFYKVELAPKFKVGKHSHPSSVINFVSKGSMTYNGEEYKAGDVMLLPQGVEYEAEAGDEGATIIMSRSFLYYNYQ